MLNIGNKISLLRKEKGWSQGDLAEQIAASREIIGKYERNENSPSLEMALKMAKAFGVTVDFLLGEGEYSSYDKDTVERIKNIQKMDSDTKSVLFNVIDTYIQNFKTKQAFATNNRIMKQVTLNVPDNKYPFFMELVKSLGFIKVSDKPELDKKQLEFVEGTKNSLKQVEQHLRGEIKLKTADQLFDEL